MNWTGGRLQRHSNNNTVTHRQKQHFSRIRTRLAAATSSPFQPRHLQPDEADWEHLGGVYGVRSPLEYQNVFDQCEMVAPVAQSLTLLKPRPPPHRHDSRRTIHDSSNTTFHPLVASHESDLTLSPPAVEVSYGKTNNCLDPFVRKGHDKEKGCDEGRRTSDGAITVDVVERERDRLLARCDWAGLAPSRPLHMHFSSSKEREAIGKRHNMYRNKTGAGIRDVMARDLLDKDDSDLGGPWMSGALVDNNEGIDIRIGTDALATQQSVGVNVSHEAEHPLTPSDPMLFDLKGVVQELQPICTQERLTTASHSLVPKKEETQDSSNLSDTGMASKAPSRRIETDPIENVARLLQELDDCSCQEPATTSPTAVAATKFHHGYITESKTRGQRDSQVSDVHDSYLPRFPTLLQELEPGGEGNSLDQAETQGQTEEQPELPSSPPKSLFRHISCESRSQWSQLHSTLALSELQSENSLALPERPGMIEERSDDVRWCQPLGISSGRTDQFPEMRRPGSKRRTSLRGIGEDGTSSTAFHDGSADHAARLGHSVGTPIDDAGHGANRRTRRVEGSQSTDRSLNSTFVTAHATANASSLSCSSALHSQPPGRAPDFPSPGSPCQPYSRIITFSENAPVVAAQDWIADADGGEEAEAVWKSFVLGDDSSQEERESPEPAIRSTLAPQRGIASSLFVEASGDSAAAGTTAPLHAAHLHSDTVDASAGHAVTSGEEQASESIAFVEVGSTRAVASPEGSRCLPVRFHDADAQANQASEDANTVAATAGESPGEVASLDRQERIIFTKPRAFVGSMAVARPAAGRDAVEGIASLSKGTMLHIEPAGTNGKISNPRKRRRGRRTAGSLPSIYGIPRHDDRENASNLTEYIEDY